MREHGSPRSLAATCGLAGVVTSVTLGACALPEYNFSSASGSGGDTTSATLSASSAGGSTSSQGGAGGSTTSSTGGTGAAGGSTTTTSTGGGTTTSTGGTGGSAVTCDQAGCPEWVVPLGSTGDDHGYAVDVGPGDKILVGGSMSAAMPINASCNLPITGAADGFVARFSTLGVCEWATTFAGDSPTAADQAVRAVAFDDTDGSMIVAGQYAGRIVFPSGMIPSLGGNDGFVARFDAIGTFKWAVTFGGSGDDIVGGVAVDSQGDVLVAASYSGGSSFNGTSLPQHGGLYEGCLVKLAKSNGAVTWLRHFGSPSVDLANAVAVGPGDAVTVVGTFGNNMDFDDGGALFNKGVEDIFALHVDPAGMTKWAQGFGAGQSETAGAVAFDGQALYMAGDFNGTLTLEQAYGNATGARDLFVTKLNLTNGVPLASKVFLDVDRQSPLRMAARTGEGLALGTTFVGTLDLGAGPTAAQAFDGFALRLAAPFAFAWQRVISGPAAERVGGVAFDSTGALLVVGDFTGPTAFGDTTLNPVSAGVPDGFLTKLKP